LIGALLAFVITLMIKKYILWWSCNEYMYARPKINKKRVRNYLYFF
jgi:hypothetical protein